MFKPVLLLLVPALAFPVLSYRTIVGDGTANAALSSADAVVPPVPEAPVFDMREEETYAVILERPLFSPSRRPFSATAPAARGRGRGDRADPQRAALAPAGRGAGRPPDPDPGDPRVQLSRQ